MSLRALIFIGFLIALTSKVFAQDHYSYGGGNFSGINQIISNPAAAADNRLKLDVILVGVDFNFNNSWFEVKREALNRTNGEFPSTWKNNTPNVPDNVFKNFNVLASSKDRAAILENRILLPSLLYQINPKNAIGFTWSVRQISNFDGMSQDMANLFEKELDLNVTQNNRIQNRNLSAVQMSWAEYGFTYARVLKDRKQHFIKAGVTPKLVKGLESAYFIVKDLDFNLSTKDTLSYFDAKLAYGHSSNFENPLKSDQPVKDFYKPVTKFGLGLDLGIIYEWRPKHQDFKYRPDGKHYKWRNDLNKYKLKLGASLVDLGKINFIKEGSYYDLDIAVRRDNFTQFTTVADYTMFDSLMRAEFSNENSNNPNYSIRLPTAFNTQIDYSFNQFFYVNLSTHFSNFYKSNSYRVYNYSSVCFAPRVEHYWFDFSLPFTYNTLSARRSDKLMTGVNVRIGPLSFGTNDVRPVFKGDVSAINFYAILKVSIPYKHLRDRDADGVKDEKDECPDIAGDPALNGCPDKDGDGVPDKSDACPNQPGLLEFKGCPDTDGDGITDGEDQCPTEKGSLFMKGCPDADNDSIADKDDACPDAAGPKKYKGCPDTDGDGIIDKEDECPTLKGIAKYKGCMNRDGDYFHDGIDPCPDEAGPIENLGCPWPDTDKDGIIDKLDSCIDLPGVEAYHGCPEPVILAPAEQKILEKAFANLEFESGKDIIKKSSYPALASLARLLKNHSSDWKIKLSGHTDNDGTEESNFILSEKRAVAVQNYLVKKGAPPENILTEWFGQTRPIGDNETNEGKRKNRRVEMTIMQRTQ
jgi:outer membrane protein OmpA-like peptidoglycan-associated protein